jgi:hypothetical protein
MDNEMNIKSKLKAILDIINEMDEMELNDMVSPEEESMEEEGMPKKVTMVSIKAKPMEKETMPEEEEIPEEEEDPNSSLGRLRKRLQGNM